MAFLDELIVPEVEEAVVLRSLDLERAIADAFLNDAEESINPQDRPSSPTDEPR